MAPHKQSERARALSHNQHLCCFFFSNLLYTSSFAYSRRRNPDLRDAGLGTWQNLMVLIGLGANAKETHNSFADLMLKEWAVENLLEKEADEASAGGAPPLSTQEILKQTTPVDRLIKSANEAAKGSMVGSGSVVAASPTARSPHLLNRQYFHKACVLIIQDDEVASIGEYTRARRSLVVIAVVIYVIDLLLLFVPHPASCPPHPPLCRSGAQQAVSQRR